VIAGCGGFVVLFLAHRRTPGATETEPVVA